MTFGGYLSELSSSKFDDRPKWEPLSNYLLWDDDLWINCLPLTCVAPNLSFLQASQTGRCLFPFKL